MRILGRVYYPAFVQSYSEVDNDEDNYPFFCFFCEKTTEIDKNNLEVGQQIRCKNCDKIICFIEKLNKRKKKKRKKRNMRKKK